MGLKFQKRTSERKKSREKVIKDAKQASDDAIAAAQACLRSDLFLMYKLEYEHTQTLIIEELIALDKNEFDPVRYGFQAKDIISKLRHIGSLLRSVEGNAGIVK